MSILPVLWVDYDVLKIEPVFVLQILKPTLDNLIEFLGSYKNGKICSLHIFKIFIELQKKTF